MANKPVNFWHVKYTKNMNLGKICIFEFNPVDFQSSDFFEQKKIVSRFIETCKKFTYFSNTIGNMYMSENLQKMQKYIKIL